MKLNLGFMALVLLSFGASAQGFQDEPTCYSWEGGHKSAGSFSKCGPRWETAKKAAPPAPAPAVVAAPVVQSVVCPAATPVPKTQIVKPKRKPPVKC